MISFIDWCKWKILGIAIIRHLVVVAWRLHKKQTDIFADRPWWVVKMLGHQRLDPSYFDEVDATEDAQTALYNMSNQAVKELAKRKESNVS